MPADSKIISFHCPAELRDCVDEMAGRIGLRSRSHIIINAVRQLNKEVKRRQGNLVPLYPNKDLHLDDMLQTVRKKRLNRPAEDEVEPLDTFLPTDLL